MPKHRDRRATKRWAEMDPPLRGCQERPRGIVATLARATSRRCTPRLPKKPLLAIPAAQPKVSWL